MNYGGVLMHFCWLTKNADSFPVHTRNFLVPYSTEDTEKQGSIVRQTSTADRKPACAQERVSFWQCHLGATS